MDRRAQAEQLAVSRFAEMMASAGVDHQRMALEVLFFLPPDFIRMYRELWYDGIGGMDDGGSGNRGRAQEETGKLGKAGTQNRGFAQVVSSGGRGQATFVSNGGAKRKSYKEHWVVLDEDILAIKDKVDKRLRGIARDVRLEVAEVNEARRWAEEEEKMSRSRDEEVTEARERAQAGGQTGAQGGARSGAARMAGRKTTKCGGCGRILAEGWKFCSYCGREIQR